MYSTSFLVNYLHLFPVPEHFIFNCLSQRRSCNLLQCSYLFYYENNILQRLKEKVVLLIAYASVKKKIQIKLPNIGIGRLHFKTTTTGISQENSIW